VKVKLAVATALAAYPLAAAMALTVSAPETEIGAEYFAEEVVGVLPSVV
jgi:hypothetical protein